MYKDPLNTFERQEQAITSLYSKLFERKDTQAKNVTSATIFDKKPTQPSTNTLKLSALLEDSSTSKPLLFTGDLRKTTLIFDISLEKFWEEMIKERKNTRVRTWLSRIIQPEHSYKLLQMARLKPLFEDCHCVRLLTPITTYLRRISSTKPLINCLLYSKESSDWKKHFKSINFQSVAPSEKFELLISLAPSSNNEDISDLIQKIISNLSKEQVGNVDESLIINFLRQLNKDSLQQRKLITGIDKLFEMKSIQVGYRDFSLLLTLSTIICALLTIKSITWYLNYRFLPIILGLLLKYMNIINMIEVVRIVLSSTKKSEVLPYSLTKSLVLDNIYNRFPPNAHLVTSSVKYHLLQILSDSKRPDPMAIIDAVKQNIDEEGLSLQEKQELCVRYVAIILQNKGSASSNLLHLATRHPQFVYIVYKLYCACYNDASGLKALVRICYRDAHLLYQQKHLPKHESASLFYGHFFNNYKIDNFIELKEHLQCIVKYAAIAFNNCFTANPLLTLTQAIPIFKHTKSIPDIFSYNEILELLKKDLPPNQLLFISRYVSTTIARLPKELKISLVKIYFEKLFALDKVQRDMCIRHHLVADPELFEVVLNVCNDEQDNNEVIPTDQKIKISQAHRAAQRIPSVNIRLWYSSEHTTLQTLTEKYYKYSSENQVPDEQPVASLT